MKNKVMLNLALIFISLVLVIGATEIILRTTHLFGARLSWAEPHPYIQWNHSLGASYWFNQENNHPITGKINRFGWRDKEWSLEKPKNTHRIAVLGDSYVEAFQVESDRTFIALTERALNGDVRGKFELMNFGRSGFTQTEELWVLKNEVMKFSPDMVIVFFLPENDIQDVRRETAPETRPFYIYGNDGQLVLDNSFSKSIEFKIKFFINPIKKHSALISFLTERYNFYRVEHAAGAIKPTVSQELQNGYLSLATDKPNEKYLGSYGLNKLLLKEMVDFCKEKKVRFLLVTCDLANAYKSEDIKKFKSSNPSFNPDFYDEDMREYAKQLDLKYIGLERIFRQSYEKNEIPLHWGHWNYQGHELVADVLTDKLKEIFF
ncbi:MAG: SGNH/GDSL hydrolase family protein [Nitrospirae bacterium]|nr:SGNH/GDSL hydrolase family protein [Nitrospirota bacterium]